MSSLLPWIKLLAKLAMSLASLVTTSGLDKSSKRQAEMRRKYDEARKSRAGRDRLLTRAFRAKWRKPDHGKSDPASKDIPDREPVGHGSAGDFADKLRQSDGFRRD